MMLGAKSLLAQTIPTAAHVAAAQAAGEDAHTHFRTLQDQIASAHHLAQHLLAQIMRANPRDPNADVMRDVLRALS
jgi:hypothetical protein